jgi:DNA-binding transcriptional LysR family regulator
MLLHYDLTDLRLLVMVVEAGGIAAAARLANLSVSALSERIKALEEGSELKLLTRTARGSRPTPEGLELAAHARAVLLQTERLNGAISALKSHETGQIKLFANSNALVSFLPDILAKFLARNKEVLIDLREMTSDEIGRAIRAGDGDIGIAASNANLEGLEVINFRRDELVLLVPTGHRLESKVAIAFVDTLDEHFIGMDDHSAIQTYVVEQASRLGRTISIRVRLRSFEGVGRLVAAGAGVAIVPVSIVTPELYAAGARPIPLTDPWATRNLVICMPGGRPPSTAVQRLLKDITLSNSYNRLPIERARRR